MARAGALTIGIFLGSLALWATPAGADPPVNCDSNPGWCLIDIGDPGDPPGGGGGGGGGGSPAVCTYRLIDPQPPAGDPAWEGHAPGDGAVYLERCPGTPDGRPGTWIYRTVWSASQPGPTLSAAVLAQEAIERLPLRASTMGISANLTPGGSGLVGVPVWLWTDATAETWGPVSRTASIPGLSVTATAQAVRIDWAMGDGHTVSCANPGTAYNPSFGGGQSPTCGYTYSQPSRGQPGGRYTITATTIWRVDWAGGGQSGQITVARTGQTTVAIGELQVVTS